MQAKVSWAGDVSFSAESGSGHTVTLDGPPNLGGQDLGARPMELMLMGLGGCTSFAKYLECVFKIVSGS